MVKISAQSSCKGNISLVVILFTVFLLVVVIGYFYYSELTPSTVDNSNTVELPLDGVKWKTYTDSNYKFTFEYPDDWEVREGENHVTELGPSVSNPDLPHLPVTIKRVRCVNPVDGETPMDCYDIYRNNVLEYEKLFTKDTFNYATFPSLDEKAIQYSGVLSAGDLLGLYIKTTYFSNAASYFDFSLLGKDQEQAYDHILSTFRFTDGTFMGYFDIYRLDIKNDSPIATVKNAVTSTSPVVEVSLWSDDSAPGIWLPYKEFMEYSLSQTGAKCIYAKFKDRDGNISQTFGAGTGPGWICEKAR